MKKWEIPARAARLRSTEVAAGLEGAIWQVSGKTGKLLFLANIGIMIHECEPHEGVFRWAPVTALIRPHS